VKSGDSVAYDKNKREADHSPLPSAKVK